MKTSFADKVEFFSEDISFQIEDKELYTKWLYRIFSKNDAELDSLNYIFCSDEYVLKINREYLDHDYYTDIISFPYAEKPEAIKGDIFISIDRITENAKEHNTNFDSELLRVMAHGILHFMGYKDKTPSEKKEMRKKEEEMIELF